MIAQLKQYILSELQRGVLWEDIEKALYNAGHQKNVIDFAFEEVKRETAGMKSSQPQGEVEKDLVGNVKGAIGGFFSKLKTRQVEDARQEIRTESTDEIIEDAVKEAKAEEQSYMFEGYVFFLYLLILTFVVFFTAGGTDDELILVVIGLCPTFLSAIVSFVLVKYAKYAPIFVLIPIAVTSLFYAVARFANMAVFKNMDYESLSIVNAVLGMLFNVILINIAFLRPAPKQVALPEQRTHRQHVHHVQEQQSQSIDDRSTMQFQKHIGDLKKHFKINDRQMS
jgi:hypothetical protein